jgi:hypothetical protein
METSAILAMIGQALQVMVIGIPGVFAVLSVFYIVLKLMMRATMGGPKDKAE